MKIFVLDKCKSFLEQVSEKVGLIDPIISQELGLYRGVIMIRTEYKSGKITLEKLKK